MTGTRTSSGRGLIARLLLAQGLVVASGILVSALVAYLIGPRLFHQHLLEAGHPPDSPELDHIERAFRDASLASLGLGLLAALVGSLVVTWFLGRQLQRPLSALTRAAREMSRGHYGTRVDAHGAGPELDSLAVAFNTMAARLEQIEDTRRRLLSDLAHEMRTPVATLRAYLESLEDGVTTWDPQVHRVLVDQTARLDRLAADLSEVSRAEEGRIGLTLELQHVDDMLRAAAEDARAAYREKGVVLVLETAPSLAVRVDRTRMGQVFANLLGNALRHTPAGGRVTLAAHAEDGEVFLTVTDTGEGIPADQLPHVFERFYRGDAGRDRQLAGSGLGLTISRALVDAHGGGLTARSEGPGRGATFTVALPPAPG